VETVKRALQEANMDKAEINRIVLVGGVTRTPKLKQLLKDFLGDIPMDEVFNPNEVVATGATIQASLLEPYASSPEAPAPVIEASSLTLGVAVAGNIVYPVIPRNTPLPCSRTVTTSTSSDGQTSVLLQVVQGECLTVEANEVIGKLVLSDIPKAAKGVTKIDVTFTLNASGELTVTAVESASKKSSSLTVQRKESNGPNDCNQQIEKAKQQDASDKAWFARVKAFSDFQQHLEKSHSQLKDKSLADPSGDIGKVCARISSWASQVKSVPTMSDVLIKRAELDVACADKEEAENEDDEGDDEEEEEEDEALD
jgi:molecular chaperone DnaK (HSP70)